jgi:arsenate reductase (thioredoxin)
MTGRSVVSQPKNVAFVCLHGSAKSLIAAEHFSRVAAAQGIDARATTSGPEPDAEIPQNVVDGLRQKGIDVTGKRPLLVTADALARADHIVSFGCDLSGLVEPGHPVERWDDCPAVSEDFAVAWSFITARVDQVLRKIEAQIPPSGERRIVTGRAGPPSDSPGD